ncbi:sodium/proline symporter [Maricaulis sp. D1M11]|uniref:sodium/proline symporter n=1 Tax=Maricaulis sp. D1M11 TaxID=3076117 RepID=UPI0039B3A5D5
MTGQTALILTSLVVYKLVLVGVGVWASRLNRSESDFFLAGQGLGPLVAGLSYAASTSSAWVLLGFSGFVFTTGLSALWMIPGIWMGYAVMWLGLGRRLREETAQEGHVTLTDFMTARTAGTGRLVLRLVSALLILFCFVFYIAAQFGAAGIAFQSEFGLGRTESVLIGAGVVLVYGLLGGFWAVSVTDTLQGLVMALIAILLPVAALLAVGGPAGLAAGLSTLPVEGFADPLGGMGLFAFLGFVVGVSGVGLGPFGQPHLMSRLMAVRDDKSRRQGFAIAMVWAVVIYLGMAVLALSGRVLVGELANGETIFYRLAADLLPAALAGIVIAAVLSAVMSTVDSILLSAAAAVSHDMGINSRFAGHEVLVSRIVMFVIAVLAIVMSLTLDSTIFNQVLFAWSALGAAFGPIVIMRVIGREPSAPALLAAMLTGFALTVVFYALGQSGGESVLHDLAALPGDPFERVFPWGPALLILYLGQSRA